LEAIVEDQLNSGSPEWELETLQVSSGNKTVPTATVCLKRGEEKVTDAAIGDGPIAALTKAIDRITGISAKLLDYQVHSVTDGEEAQGEVDVKIEIDGVTIHGRGVSTDIIEASAKAYLNALCRASARVKNKPPEEIIRPGHIAPKSTAATP
jgi:2-isopropylmalate synthase